MTSKVVPSSEAKWFLLQKYAADSHPWNHSPKERNQEEKRDAKATKMMITRALRKHKVQGVQVTQHGDDVYVKISRGDTGAVTSALSKEELSCKKVGDGTYKVYIPAKLTPKEPENLKLHEKFRKHAAFNSPTTGDATEAGLFLPCQHYRAMGNLNQTHVPSRRKEMNTSTKFQHAADKAVNRTVSIVATIMKFGKDLVPTDDELKNTEWDMFIPASYETSHSGLILAAVRKGPAVDYPPKHMISKATEVWKHVLTSYKSQIFKSNDTYMQWKIAVLILVRACCKRGFSPFKGKRCPDRKTGEKFTRSTGIQGPKGGRRSNEMGSRPVSKKYDSMSDSQLEKAYDKAKTSAERKAIQKVVLEKGKRASMVTADDGKSNQSLRDFGFEFLNDITSEIDQLPKKPWLKAAMAANLKSWMRLKKREIKNLDSVATRLVNEWWSDRPKSASMVTAGKSYEQIDG